MNNKYIYILRICLLPLRNPLTIDNLHVFTEYQDALEKGKYILNKHKLSLRDTNEFNNQDRNYIYEDFIGEQFIWIERHKINNI